jgi:hypothetical protein
MTTLEDRRAARRKLPKAVEAPAGFKRLKEMTYREVLKWAGTDRDRLEQVRLVRGYKRGWIGHVIAHTKVD